MSQATVDRPKLFEYAVLHHPTPTKDQRESGERPKSALIVAPTTVLARDPQEAAIYAARGIDAKYVEKLDEVEVVIRPF